MCALLPGCLIATSEVIQTGLTRMDVVSTGAGTTQVCEKHGKKIRIVQGNPGSSRAGMIRVMVDPLNGFQVLPAHTGMVPRWPALRVLRVMPLEQRNRPAVGVVLAAGRRGLNGQDVAHDGPIQGPHRAGSWTDL